MHLTYNIMVKEGADEQLYKTGNIFLIPPLGVSCATPFDELVSCLCEIVAYYTKESHTLL